MFRSSFRRLRRRFVRPGRSLQERFPSYEIGRGSYGPITVKTFGPGEQLKIGNYCSFAQDVHILLGGNHRLDWVTTFPFSALHSEYRTFEGHPATKGAVIIGHDVWVGHGATILSGVEIGTGAVVGAGSVVTGNIPPYAIAVGNPARVVGYRFDGKTIASLLKIAWWNWSEAEVDRAMPMLLSNDIQSFILEYSAERTKNDTTS